MKSRDREDVGKRAGAFEAFLSPESFSGFARLPPVSAFMRPPPRPPLMIRSSSSSLTRLYTICTSLPLSLSLLRLSPTHSSFPKCLLLLLLLCLMKYKGKPDKNKQMGEESFIPVRVLKAREEREQYQSQLGRYAEIRRMNIATISHSNSLSSLSLSLVCPSVVGISTAAAKTCNFRSKRPKFECFLLKNLSVKVKIFLVVVVVGGERRCQWSAARPFVSLPFAIGRSQQRWEMGTQWGSATATIRLLRDIFNVNNIDSLLHKQEEKNKVIQRRHQRKSQTSDFLFKQPTSNPPKGTHSELWNSFCQRLPLPYLRHNSILQSSFKFCEKSIKDRS